MVHIESPSAAPFIIVPHQAEKRSHKNNPDKFPDRYVLTLTKEEKQEVIKNFDKCLPSPDGHSFPLLFSGSSRATSSSFMPSSIVL